MTGNKIKNMEEFAAVCGISRPTVSKYFNDPASVRESTRVRIEVMLAKYDYQPNIFAVNQNRKSTKTIGIVVPYLADPFFAEIARKMEQHCIDKGFHPTLYSSHGDVAVEIEILQNLKSLKPAGVLLAPLGRTTDRSVLERFSEDVPTVLFDCNVTRIGLPFIGSDCQQFANILVEDLIKSGSPPCFFEMRTPANPNANKRREAYIKAMARYGHSPSVVQIDGKGWDFERIGLEGGLQALETDQFTSNTVMCSNDRLAIGLLAACFEKGVSVGREDHHRIRVAGQDDHPFARFTCPSLTTVAQDYDAISRRAFEILALSILGETQSNKSHLFEGKLVRRGSA